MVVHVYLHCSYLILHKGVVYIESEKGPKEPASILARVDKKQNSPSRTERFDRRTSDLKRKERDIYVHRTWGLNRGEIRGNV